MTMTTRFAILAPYPYKQAFRFVQTLLGDPERMRPFPWSAATLEGDRKVGRERIGNDMGQGFAALLDAHGAIEKPLTEVHYNWNEETDEEIEEPLFKYFVMVSFDTAYGYTGANSAGCGDLHAWIVTQLVDFCNAQNLPWRYYDESWGEWHDDLDGLDKLGDPEKGALR